MAGESVWARRAPIWLRILAGVLIFPILWVALASLYQATLAAGAHSPVAPWILIVAATAAGIASWITVRASSACIAVGLLAVGLAGIALMSSTFLLRQSSPNLEAEIEEASPASSAAPKHELRPYVPPPEEAPGAPGSSYPDVLAPEPQQ